MDPSVLQIDRKHLLHPQELNWYSYVLNNPLRLFDPNGERPYDPNKSFAENLWDQAKDFGTGMLSIAKGTVTGATDGIVSTGNAIIHLDDTLTGAYNAVTHPVETLEAIGNGISNTVQKIANGDYEGATHDIAKVTTVFVITKKVGDWIGDLYTGDIGGGTVAEMNPNIYRNLGVDRKSVV